MNKLLGIFTLAFISFSCSSDLDFNQVNKLKINPVLVGNLSTFEIQANQFVNGSGVEQPVSGDLLNFDFFRDNYFNKNLARMDFYFEIRNTIIRDFTINLYFFDDNNTLLDTIQFNVPAYSGVEKVVTKTEIFQNTNLDILKKSTKVAFVITMYPGFPLDKNSLGSIKFRSSATIYLNAE
jgi:hypothetical protein